MFISSFFFELDQNEKLRPEFIDLLLPCCTFSWCFRAMAKDGIKYVYNSLDIFVLLFFIWAASSAIWAVNYEQSLFELFKLTFSIFFYLITKSLIIDKNMLRRVITLLVIVGVFQALLSLISIWIDNGFGWSQPIASNVDLVSRFWGKKDWQSDGGRGTGTAVAHTTGFLLNMVLFPAIGYLFISKKSQRNRLWTTGLIIITAGMTSTLTKSSIASFLIGSFFIIIHIRKLRKFLFLSVLLLMVFFIAVSSLSRIRDLEKSIKFTQHQMDSGKSDTSMGTRLEWWGEGLDKLVDTVGIGYGVGGFKSVIDNVVPDGSHHAVLFDLGLLGFSIYIFILGFSFLQYYCHLKNCMNDYFRKLMLTYLAGYLVMVISWLVTLYYTYTSMWFYIGLGYAMINISNKCEDESGKESGKDSYIVLIGEPAQ
jgi:hypothetical protein